MTCDPHSLVEEASAGMRESVQGRAFLRNHQTHDVQTFVLVPLIVAVAAVLAANVPALCATRVDPIEVLRHE